MDHDIFSTYKILIAQVGMGIVGGVATLKTVATVSSIPWIPIGTLIGLAITAAYTLYKWKWSSKFNNIEWEIKQETLRQLKNRA